jgi:hypothetical protein
VLARTGRTCRRTSARWPPPAAAASALGPYDDGAGGGGLNLGLHVATIRKPCAPTARACRRCCRAARPGSRRCTAPPWSMPPRSARRAGADRRRQHRHRQPGVVCAILTADCLPVLFADLEGKVVGAAHAGWRGLAGGVLAATLAQMRARAPARSRPGSGRRSVRRRLRGRRGRARRLRGRAAGVRRPMPSALSWPRGQIPGRHERCWRAACWRATACARAWRRRCTATEADASIRIAATASPAARRV